MYLMLYLATSLEEPLQNTPDLSVEDLGSTGEAVRRWLSLPNVRFVGAHTGCSSGFRHIIAEEEIEYYERMLGDPEDHEASIRSARALLALVRRHVTASPRRSSARAVPAPRDAVIRTSAVILSGSRRSGCGRIGPTSELRDGRRS